jgi:hypothetical protein
MIRRTFLKALSVAALPMGDSPVLLPGAIITGNESWYIELDSTQRMRIYRDFSARYGVSQFTIDDQFFEAKDDSYPRYSLEISREEYFRRHGFYPTYFWREHAVRALSLRRGETYDYIVRIDNFGDVVVYEWQYDLPVLVQTYYVFPNGAVGSVIASLRDSNEEGM